MSKKYFVLFSLKELFQPRIFKTKMTVNKYLKENNNLQFRQFNSEQEADLFSKEVEQEVNSLILTSDNSKLQQEITAFQRGSELIGKEKNSFEIKS